MVKSTSHLPLDREDCAGHALLELMVSLAVGAILLAILTTMTIATLRMEEKLSYDDRTRQNSRRAYTYFQKQILSADKVIIDKGQVYIRDMDPVDTYYNRYSLDDQGVLCRLKYRERPGGMESIGAGQTSHLIDGVESFQCQFLPPKGIAITIQFKDGYALEEVFYVGGELVEH